MTLQILRKGHVQKEKCVKEWNHNYTQFYGTKRGPTTWNHVSARKHDFKNGNTHLKREGVIAVIFIFLWRSGKLAAISEARTKKQPEGPQITLPNQRVSVTIGKRKQTSSICHFGKPTTRVFILVSFCFYANWQKVWVGCPARFPKARATGLFGYREGSFPPGLLFCNSTPRQSHCFFSSSPSTPYESGSTLADR